MSNGKDSTVNESNAEIEQPAYVTKDEFNKVLNQAISTHLKRLDFSKQISDSLEAALTPFKEQFGSKSETPKEASSTSSPEVSALQKKLESMEKSMKLKEEALQKRERQSREKDAFAALRSELSSSGVRPEAVDHLSKILKAEERIRISDEGDVSFMSLDDEEVDLKVGLKSYLDPKKNPAIALYLPPKANGKITSPAAKQTSISRSTEQSPGTKQYLNEKQKAQLALEQIQSLGLKL